MKRQTTAIFLSLLCLCALHNQCFAIEQSIEQMNQVNLQNQIDKAIALGQKKLIIAAGTYRIAPPKDDRPHLQINGAMNLKIIAIDVHLVCTTLNRAIDVNHSTGLTIEGLSIDYDPLPFTQATVTGLSKDSRFIDMILHKGYPPIDSRVRISVIDSKTRRIKAGTWTRYSGHFEKLKNGIIRFDQGKNFNDTLAVGDYLVLSHKTQTPHAIMLTNCTNCTLRQITLHSSTSFGFLERGGGSNRYDQLTITPGLPPDGATQPRLLSTLADGFHSKHTHVGPRVENCRFDHMGDDGIAINGDFILVLDNNNSPTNPVITMAFKREPYVKIGDRIIGRKRASGLPAGIGIVKTMERIETDAQSLETLKKEILPELRHPTSLFTTSNVYRLTLDKPLSVVRGDIASCPDRNGSGFVVQNNTIRDNRARGILIKASDGKIVNNTITGSSMSGIVLGPEIDYWMEADFSRNVLIRGNAIKSVNHAPSNNGSIFAGAITVAGSGLMPAGGQQDITIDRNLIEKTTGPAILLTSAKNVKITISKQHLSW